MGRDNNKSIPTRGSSLWLGNGFRGLDILNMEGSPNKSGTKVHAGGIPRPLPPSDLNIGEELQILRVNVDRANADLSYIITRLDAMTTTISHISSMLKESDSTDRAMSSALLTEAKQTSSKMDQVQTKIDHFTQGLSVTVNPLSTVQTRSMSSADPTKRPF